MPTMAWRVVNGPTLRVTSDRDLGGMDGLSVGLLGSEEVRTRTAVDRQRTAVD